MHGYLSQTHAEISGLEKLNAVAFGGKGVQQIISITRGVEMKIGEVCILTNDVIRFSDFYRLMFKIDSHSTDDVH